MNRPLWTSSDMELATGGDASAAFEVTGSISIDTRTLQKGDLFVALKDQRDGHDFVEAAFKAGAAGALVSRPMPGGPVVQVEDVLEALTQMGIAARVRCGAHRTAVTGSAGKTSVKEMLAQIYRAHGPAHWNVKSFNNHWGVPLTLARMPEETQRAVFEIGMNTPGEIAPRSQMVRPHTGIVTCIAAAHLQGLGSVEGIAEEKANIFAGLESGGTIILPADDTFLDYLSERARSFCPTGNVETFGASPDATARIVAYETDGRTSRVEVSIVGQRVAVTLNAVGAHWAQNVAAALLAASQASLSVKDCAEALSGYAPPPGRGTSETLVLPDIGEITLIDDAYNANPASMRAALKGLAQRAGTRRLAALGDMKEIGDSSAAEHRGLASSVVEAGVDGVFLVGAEMQHLSEALPRDLQQVSAPTADELWNQLQKALRAGDVLLIKGSNASGMGRIADRLRQWSVPAGLGKMDGGPEGAARVS
ncbi:UDP-N-acetylmuramoyl-tripeptide--D-alanyl-D-alanine ligase [Hyphomonas neptunium ATCC 15444]|uniref:UDP-N-acetylmuramoyl-tripeptide--D-alanyl-D-alanine ligase n=2 Tax=Hyphomonas TaxID=85 RepID=Q0BXT8_HYPNA|nr:MULTISPECIES: UDP-N-acetylmuramoyl-tripeptide--D-alanyl-D-alanine ligase [Hyphomonas]ABI77992.1 UDP-N-acetylmuramoyl-tripeptide--D-alanyl-D-alanine ligase [Hyphomonas neptunium ATCC 15444]KCZ93604.1 UDP-N-acetylmuramoyl-tripeptide--D-alanyl-D-alanine ligase [Hyphomonas hirschiana VP5]